MELLEIIHVLTRGCEHNRFAGNRSNGKSRTTTGVTIKFREHYAGKVHTLVEGICGIHGVLTNHRVDYEQDFLRLNSIADITRLLHEFSIHTQTACGINDHHVMELRTRFSNAISCNLHRIASRGIKFTGHARVGRENGYARALAHNLQLGYRVWALQVRCHQDGGMPLPLEPLREFTRQRGFTGTLQTSQHNNGGTGLSHVNAASLPAQNGNKLFVYNLDDLL